MSMFRDRWFAFYTFYTIVLSVLQYMDSDYTLLSSSTSSVSYMDLDCVIFEYRKMRAKQQQVCKEMNQYTNNANRK